MPLPVEIVGLLRSTVTFVWEDGHESVYPARALRLACRCAECIEEMTGRPLLEPSRVPEAVRARTLGVVGNYALRVDWSDGHNSGIYHFRQLRADCPCDGCQLLRKEGKLPGAG